MNEFDESTVKTSVLFVCMGNICRSPTAEGIFRHKVQQAGLGEAIHIDSAGTHAYHIGQAPDPRAIKAAARRGYDLSPLRARKIEVEDFHRFDHVLAMDEDNLAILTGLRPGDARAGVRLVMEYAPALGAREVPDPYYGGEAGFERMVDMLEAATDSLLAELRARHGLG